MRVKLEDGESYSLYEIKSYPLGETKLFEF